MISNPHPDLTSSVIWGLGWFYLLLFLVNLGWTARSLKEKHSVRLPQLFGGMKVPVAGFWALYTALLGMIAITHLTGSNSPESFTLRMPEGLKSFIDTLADPVRYFALSMILFVGAVAFRKRLVQPGMSWFLLNLSLVFIAFSLTDWDFRQIVGKPDNVPIVGMLFIVAFFTWLSFKRAVDNDDRIAAGRPLREQEDNEKVLVWPDLVYTELVCMVLLTAFLVVWGIILQAPLEEPASSVKTPNPSKAPWYFLGLQEMLVYYDPWLAGVVFPSVILVGLMAVPYIDFNKKGNGYYTYNERKFAILTFLFGFLPLWVAMIILGTFLRGPNWNIFGIYEYWDVHKLEVLNNVNLSEMFWLQWMPDSLKGLPTAPAGADELTKIVAILKREAPGILLTILYLTALPPLMAATVFRGFFHRMGFLRFMVFSNLLLLMAALPIKMLLRWTINLKYLVAIPEYLINI